jgi:beta-N-acetylhexosaminidase
LNNDLYNRQWFETRIRLYKEDLESSMISPSLISLSHFEEDKILRILSSMSLKEKIGQLFILDLKNRDKNLYYTEMNDDLDKYIEEFRPGGVLLFSGNIYSNQQVKNLISDLQSISGIPLFIAIDQEGGRVSRLNSNSKMDVLDIPSHEILGKLNDVDLTWQIGKIIGEELKYLGFNMNLAPVADINSNYKNPVLGDRSFSENKEVVSALVKPFVQGLQESGVCSVIKHFPGHGDTGTDPHSGEVSIDLKLTEIRNRELLPFSSGISQGAAGVITAHIKTPNIVESNGLPATLSSFFIRDILREEMEFNGLVISDSFTMAAIRDFWLSGESATIFIVAGGDIILRPSDINAAMDGILESLKNGILTNDRINKSVFRILAVKYRFGFFDDHLIPNKFDLEEGQLFLDKIMGKYENQNLNN